MFKKFEIKLLGKELWYKDIENHKNAFLTFLLYDKWMILSQNSYEKNSTNKKVILNNMHTINVMNPTFI